jgi:hypothetical protein
MTDSTPRKGQKFWTIRMDKTGRYEVVPATFRQTDERGHGTKFYRIPVEYEGKADSVVVDIRDENVFRSEREALVECARRCREVAAGWHARADELLARLADTPKPRKEKP